MELQGKIIAVQPERSGVSARGEWKVQEYVLETVNTQYPRKMAFEVFGADRIQRFNIQVGQEVLVAFDIDAREYNGRWYNSIRAFDVRPASQVAQGVSFEQGVPVPGAEAPVQSAPVQPAVQAAPTQMPADPFGGDDADKLPF